MGRHIDRKARDRSRSAVVFALIALASVLLATACANGGTSKTLPISPPLVRAEEPETPVSGIPVAESPVPEALEPEPRVEVPVQPAGGEGHEASAMPSLADETLAEASDAMIPPETCLDRELDPLPSRTDPGSQGFWLSFREPLPPAPVWNPPGPKRVGLQAGHWLNDEVPRELNRLAGSGTAGGGYAEWQVNLNLAQRTAAILQSYGVEVDILPATVPPSYRAHIFLTIHADGDITGVLRGFKVARAGFSSVPEADDALVAALNLEYGATTGLRRDDEHISRKMQYYYAFNSRRYCHAIAPGVPAAIIETGFLTNAADRAMLLNNPDALALGIARGVLRYLDMLDG